jgi:hypothetical protein
VPDIAPTTWSKMWTLYDEGDETMFRVLAWVARERIPKDLVEDVVQTIGPYIDAGGKLSDLLVGDPDEPPDTPYSRSMRMLSIVRGWLEDPSAARLSAESRARAAETVRAIIRLLESRGDVRCR